MSKTEQRIVCRNCSEEMPLTEECPYCGASVRSDKKLFAAIGLGLVVLGASLFDLSQLRFFALIGLAILIGSGSLLYDKRRRINQARDEEENLFPSQEDSIQ